jgi:hypothetical protein
MFFFPMPNMENATKIKEITSVCRRTDNTSQQVEEELGRLFGISSKTP